MALLTALAELARRRAPHRVVVKVRARGGEAQTHAEEHDYADSPLADYGVKDVDDARLSGGLAGVIGVGVTVAAGTGVFWAVRRRRSADDVSPVSTSV